MIHKEPPKHEQDLIVERYRSWEGYGRMSKALDIPQNAVKMVINKRRKYDTTVSTGHPSKTSEKKRRKQQHEKAYSMKRPTET